MTIATTTRKVTYTGTGALSVFSIPFHFQKTADIVITQVYQGVTTVVTGYTIAGVGIGAIVTFTFAPPNGASITIERTVALKQETNFRTQGAFPPAAVEDALDRLTMMHQQREDTISALLAADVSILAGLATEAVSRTAAIAAAQVAILATFATEAAALRVEFNSAPGSTVDARTVLAATAITARALSGHMQDKLNIKDFGATAPGTGAANDAAITAALAVLEFAPVPPGTYTVATMPDMSRLYGAGRLSLGGVIFELAPSPSPTVPENRLPNTQWQIGSGHGVGSKMAASGTGTKVPLVVTSYETGTNTPYCYCAAMADLKVGDLLAFSAASDIVFRITLVEVTEVGVDGFRVLLPLGKKPAASAACTALPSMNGGFEAVDGRGDAFDEWQRTPTVNLTGTTTWTNGFDQVSGVGTAFTTELVVGGLIRSANVSAWATITNIASDILLTIAGGGYVGPTEIGVIARRPGSTTWREDHAVNVREGSKYSCGFRKAMNPSEHLTHQIPSRYMHLYKGKRVVFGVGVMHKIRNDATKTWRIHLNSDGTGGGVKNSPPASAAVGAWEWREFSIVIPTNATYFYCGIEFQGAKNDVYYVTHPMLSFGRYLGPWNYSQPKNEYLIPIVHGQFYSFVNSSPTLPSALTGLGKGNETTLQGATNNAHKTFVINPHAETNGVIAPTVRELIVKLEGRSSSVGDPWGLTNTPLFGVAHVFGPLLYSQSAGHMMPPQKASVPLDTNGRMHVLAGLTTLSGLMQFVNGSNQVVGTAGTGTKFLSELTPGMLIKLNNNSGNKMYRVKSITDDALLFLGIPGGADATYDEATTATNVGALKIDANWYNFALEANAYVLS